MRCICFDLLRLRCTLLCTLYILLTIFFGGSEWKKLPFFGCRFFEHIFFFLAFAWKCQPSVCCAWLCRVRRFAAIYLIFQSEKLQHFSEDWKAKQKKMNKSDNEKIYIYTSHFCGCVCLLFFSSKATEIKRENSFLKFYSFDFFLPCWCHCYCLCAWPLVNKLKKAFSPQPWTREKNSTFEIFA